MCIPNLNKVSYHHFPDHAVFLTFDDGPAPSTKTVLDTLKKEGIQALFFVVGEMIHSQEKKNILSEIVKEGHMLGNHGYRHVNMTKLSSKEQIEALEKTNDCIAFVQSKVLYYRPPGGSYNAILRRSVNGLGMRVMLWNVDPQDWKHPRPDEKTLVTRVLEGLKKQRNRGIILLHDIHPNTAKHLSALIQALRKEGYQFLKPDQVENYQNPCSK